jgi:hypothetical protein
MLYLMKRSPLIKRGGGSTGIHARLLGEEPGACPVIIPSLSATVDKTFPDRNL